MEHVEVLRHMNETIKAIMPSEVAALDAAIASLSAPQPAAVDGRIVAAFEEVGKWAGPGLTASLRHALAAQQGGAK